MEEQYKYFAFISYNSRDTEWGKKLQRKLEHYRMPATLCSEHNWERTPISPVFFAPTDIQPGGLTEELQERLRASRNLIVICSPNSAQSEWVGREIEYFHSIGRTKNIHFFIVEGTPHSGDKATECFNPVVDKLGLPEILAANIHEKIYRSAWLNKERAYVQLISKLLGVEFDAIWQRHKRQLINKVITLTLAGIAVIAALLGVWVMNQPFDADMRLSEASAHNENLPPMRDALVTMTLDNETKSDTLQTIDSQIVFTNIPHRFLDKQVSVSFRCKDFIDLDTVMTLTKNNVLNVRRDPSVYGDVRFFIWDVENEDYIANTGIEIDQYEAVSDENGLVTLFIPLEMQKETYHIKAPFPLVNEYVTMPCGEADVIMTK